MRLALEPDLTVVGEAGDGAMALALVKALRPDVVVMDIDLPHLDGLTVTALLREIAPQSAVVVLSLQDDRATCSRARAAGAVAFVSKQARDEALLAAIRAAAGRG